MLTRLTPRKHATHRMKSFGPLCRRRAPRSAAGLASAAKLRVGARRRRMPWVRSEYCGVAFVADGEAAVAENHHGNEHPNQHEARAEHDLNQREGHGRVSEGRDSGAGIPVGVHAFLASSADSLLLLNDRCLAGRSRRGPFTGRNRLDPYGGGGNADRSPHAPWGTERVYS